MIKRKNKGSILLLTAGILSLLSVVMYIFITVVLSFDLWGMTTNVINMLISQGITDAASEVNFMCFEMAILAFINIYFAMYYIKGFKYRIAGRNYGHMVVVKGIWQILLGSALPAIVAIIAGVKMKNTVHKPVEVTPTEEVQTNGISNYKLEAMGEAVARLKELKDRGAISEEEYYINLNKILEG